MGCDIWTYLEKRNPETGKWERLKVYKKKGDEYEVVYPYDLRNYELFSLLAGVRGWHEPLVSPRGVPIDASEEVREEWEDYCYHTPTWYDMRELILLANALPDKDEDEDYSRKEMLKNFIFKLGNYIDYSGNFWWGDEVNKYRVIMWFDS